MSTTANREAWARLEAMLVAMHLGDVVTVDAAIQQSGIGVKAAERVFDALVRADLFEQHGRQFVRVSAFRGAELHHQQSIA